MTDRKHANVDIRPADRRCRYWAKIVRQGTGLPAPDAVDGANDVPGSFLRNGQEELFEGDVLIEGEANHHTKQRGWTYSVVWVNEDGALCRLVPDASVKRELKQGGIDPALLPGSGGPAACIRVAHALRAGVQVTADNVDGEPT